MSRHVAIVTLGLLRRASDFVLGGFFERVMQTYAEAEASPGFLARWDPSMDPEGPWGTPTTPRCFGERDPSRHMPATLSLWRDLPSIAAYAYGGHHKEGLSLRRAWFEDHDAPGYALYWVEAGRIPQWREAVDRFDHLHEHGATPHAFDFATAFDASGQACKVARSR